MAHIVEHLPVEELEARYRASQDATEARHLQAIRLLAQERTVLEVAGVLAFGNRGRLPGAGVGQAGAAACRTRSGSGGMGMAPGTRNRSPR